MNIRLDATHVKKIASEISISGSKSESNRLLILQQLFQGLQIDNLSDSDDSEHMQDALSSKEMVVNIGHAGTAMRFLTSYFAATPNRNVVLTGSERMQNRPIRILVEALRDLGARISYMDKEGYPPLEIKGTFISENKVHIQGNVSSQYISSLLLIGGKLPNGLKLVLEGEITSLPYIQMTLDLLNQVGIQTEFKGKEITVYPVEKLTAKQIVVESDWSSASYFYSIAASAEIGSQITLTAYKKQSLQGDSCLAEIYRHFGVETSYGNESITLSKTKKTNQHSLELDLRNAPDIAQTIAVSCFSEGIPCNLTGLHTLKIKETDRLVALENELSKFGATISVSNESLHLKSSTSINSDVTVATYNDHRMAMAFAPLALKVPFTIEDAMVVTKSYKNFWEDMTSLGFTIS
ncbi:MAG: 3-phosphoshikimate 1-carboxyvinyltransferase [Flavobacteriaceae bacterium]|nr:3-phosphoshikimate 1-carboxyvinyltransferase [Flavobacteriaceae bacterium]|tara:strand:- start:26977 stop:28200 length:1224 start_codon:yes stop_codon:yes gene_type:complete